MSSSKIKQYYKETKNRPVRKDLEYAASLVTKEKIATDCGYGAGADIQYLRSNDFIVHAFDMV